jgi:hypothetical protein
VLWDLPLAVRVLDRFSLAAVTETAITVHRLVQTVTRQALSDRAARRWAGLAVRLVDAALPDDSATCGPGPPAPGCPHTPTRPSAAPAASPTSPAP